VFQTKPGMAGNKESAGGRGGLQRERGVLVGAGPNIKGRGKDL